MRRRSSRREKRKERNKKGEGEKRMGLRDRKEDECTKLTIGCWAGQQARKESEMAFLFLDQVGR